MKKKYAGIRIAFTICAALGWWGMLYPELTMTPDTYEIIWEEDMADIAAQTEDNLPEWDFDSDIYRMILEADGSRIRFRSRLLTKADEFWERLK